MNIITTFIRCHTSRWYSDACRNDAVPVTFAGLMFLTFACAVIGGGYWLISTAVLAWGWSLLKILYIFPIFIVAWRLGINIDEWSKRQP